MKKYKIVLLPGDGIGPEISEVSKNVLKKLSKNHNFDIEIIEKRKKVKTFRKQTRTKN